MQVGFIGIGSMGSVMVPLFPVSTSWTVLGD
jgi:hypothetical protein